MAKQRCTLLADFRGVGGMSSGATSTLPSTFDLQTLQPKLRLHGPVVLLILIGSFPLFYFLERGPNRIFHCALAALALGAVSYHFWKESGLVRDRLIAVAVITYYGNPVQKGPRILRRIFRRFAPDVPIIEYSFVAFDQKTYTGQTGWRSRGLYEGAQIAVLYKPGKPKVNHPAASFIFYSFAAG
jgi:hypothetical protein